MVAHSRSAKATALSCLARSRAGFAGSIAGLFINQIAATPCVGAEFIIESDFFWRIRAPSTGHRSFLVPFRRIAATKPNPRFVIATKVKQTALSDSVPVNRVSKKVR